MKRKTSVYIFYVTVFLVLFNSCEIFEPESPEDAQQITTSGNNFNPRWSPDSSRIAFSSGKKDGSKQIWVHYLNENRAVKITRVGNNRNITWSPDGNYLAFWSIVETRDREEGEIWIYPFKKGSLPYSLHRSFYSYGYDLMYIDWSPSGKYLTIADEPYLRREITLMDLSDGKMQELNINGSYPRWGHNDSTLFYYNYSDTENYEWIIKYNFNTESNDTIYMNSYYYDRAIDDIAVSPSGLWIAYTHTETYPGAFLGSIFHNIGLISVSSDGIGEPIDMLITTNGVSSQPSWSPDGKQIVFISDGDLWIRDVPDIVD